MSKGAELLSQGEIVENECLSREYQGANGPDGELEEKEHRRKMQADLCDRKGKMGETVVLWEGADSRFKAQRTEYWRGTEVSPH